jgi:hypothetical protein
MSLERLEVAASGLSFVLSAFPLLSIIKKEEKEEKTKKIEEEDIDLQLQNRKEKAQHN